MIQRCYSVYDLKAGAFAPPFFVVNDQVAVRVFAAAQTDPSHPMSRFPEDFQLHRIGEFDDETGNFECLAQPEHVVTAHSTEL